MLCAVSDGPSTTRALATALSEVVTDGDLLVLTGDLGAGKTCFTQGLGAGLGIEDRITSPTFTLVAEYEGRLRLHHLDVYRLDGPADTIDLDLHELAEEGVTVIEWGEQIDTALGADRLVIEIAFLDPEPTSASASDALRTPDASGAPDGGAAPDAPGTPDGSALGAGADTDGFDEFVTDDRRRLRLRLVGERWQARADAVATAVAPWEAPC